MDSPKFKIGDDVKSFDPRYREEFRHNYPISGKIVKGHTNPNSQIIKTVQGEILHCKTCDIFPNPNPQNMKTITEFLELEED